MPRKARARARWRPLAFLSVIALAVVAALAACSGTSSTTLRPTTGILIRAETLTTGRGCGRAPTNLFKYAVVVFGYNGQAQPDSDPDSYTTPVLAAVFDCFTDGSFVQLDPVNESSTYRLEVYAYNEPGFSAFRTAIESAGTDTTALKTTAPTWTTECSATQLRDAQTLAQCRPLAAGLGGLGGDAPTTKIALGTSSFRLSDGRLARCGFEPTDAGTDAQEAGLDAAADATDDANPSAPIDAGPPVMFASARIRYRIGATLGPTVDLPCPTTFVADVLPEPARYDIDVGVLAVDGTPIGTTLCSVTTQAGATSSAVCPP